MESELYESYVHKLLRSPHMHAYTALNGLTMEQTFLQTIKQQPV